MNEMEMRDYAKTMFGNRIMRMWMDEAGDLVVVLKNGEKWYIDRDGWVMGE